MENVRKAIETTGVIDTERHLTLDDFLPIAQSTRVRVLIFLPDDLEISESAWLHAASQNPAFDFLKDSEEEVYSVEEGKPFDDLSGLKVRPAVCLTEPLGRHHHIILAFISSRHPGELVDSDLLIRNTHKDFVQTGLRFSSTLKLPRLMTVASSFILREWGGLSPRVML